MNERTNDKTKLIFLYKTYRYVGFLIDETPTHFKINDYKEGIILLPKSETLVKGEIQ